MSVLDLEYDFSALSAHDLLEARDTYHFHLLSKANVVGTAIGYYLIRTDEPWPKRRGEGVTSPKKKSIPRTLFNSEVRDYSWPCVLVFVRSWAQEEAFGPSGRYSPSKIVPRTLYMPDGRAVPVCVVQVDEAASGESEGVVDQQRPAYFLGGGMPIEIAVQGAVHTATIGCLVSDGHLTYALTARHASGEANTIVSSQIRSGDVPIGTSSHKQLSRRLFSEVYPSLPGRRSYSAIDVGLVKIDDVTGWTSNVYGLPQVGPLADLNDTNLSLRLIDQPLIASGAASGVIAGRVKALFYRYRSVGGFDYVGDFLIAPDGERETRPGDSGMVWHLDVTAKRLNDPPPPLSARDLRPLAVEWGGQAFSDSGKRSTFAIASSLSNVCRLLNVELVTDQSRGVSGYWGRTGHYSIATFALGMVKNAALKRFLSKNAEILSFDLSAIAEKDFDKSVGQISAANEFVPLADVPDEIWKKLPRGKQAREGGRDIQGGRTGSDGPEHPNHYADIDAPIYDDKKTWRDLCLADAKKIEPNAWLQFYRDMAKWAKQEGLQGEAENYGKPFKQGLLPFRIWQFYDALVGFAATGDAVGFLTAAGVAAHYMGDGSQPLHGSIYADGDPTRKVTRSHPRTGEDEEVIYGNGVHSAYETAMVSLHAADLISRIQGSTGSSEPVSAIRSGKDAAKATLELMKRAAAILPPLSIVDAYEAAGAGTSHATLNALWDQFGDQTAEVLALGASYLAALWDAAWEAGNGAAIAASKLKQYQPEDVRPRYIDTKFVPSLTLSQIGTVLKH
jgi:hypothetical protein